MSNQRQSLLKFILIPLFFALIVFFGYLILFSLFIPENQIISLHQLILSSAYMLCGVMSILLAIKHNNIIIRILFALYALYLLPPATHLLFSSGLFFSNDTAIMFYVFYSNIFMYFTLGLVIQYSVFFLSGKYDNNPGEVGTKLIEPFITIVILIFGVYSPFIINPEYLTYKSHADTIAEYYLPLFRVNFIFLIFLAFSILYGFILFRKRYKPFFKKKGSRKKIDEDPFVKLVLLLNLIFLTFIIILDLINAACGLFQINLNHYFNVFIFFNDLLLLCFYLFIQIPIAKRPLLSLKSQVGKKNEGKVDSRIEEFNISILKIIINAKYRLLLSAILVLVIIFIPFLIAEENRLITRILLAVIFIVGIIVFSYIKTFVLKYIRTVQKKK